MIKKLGAVILAVAAGLVLTALMTVLLLRPAEKRSVSGERMAQLLAPLTWVEPRVQLGSLSFTLFGPHQFEFFSLGAGAPLEREGGDELFTFDPQRFVRSQGKGTFREAQLAYFSKQKFDRAEARFTREAPHLASWGALPYPPLHQSPEPVRIEPFPENFLSRAAFHEQLDRLTGYELTRNESVKLLQNGQAFGAMQSLAARSKRFLFLNVLSLTCDPTTETFFGILEERARSGTDVRILINRKFAQLDRACIRRLKNSDIAVLGSDTHASYLVADQGELIIGSESIARMFAASTGYNFLDRDLMLDVRGPVATDSVQDFISDWEESRGASDRSSEEALKFYKDHKEVERARGLRDPRAYAKWLGNPRPQALCRFAGQKPRLRSTAVSDLMIALTGQARSEIFLSGVDLGDSPVSAAIREKARAGTRVDFLGNGWESGDGELTMVLDEWISSSEAEGRRKLARALEILRDWDRRRVARDRFADMRGWATVPGFQAWAQLTFQHYKAWSFDGYGIWVGSSNPDRKSYDALYEAGALCLDQSLAEAFGQTRTLDLANSVPYIVR
jgi:phosphatidylserine/phosphatidylglycerophosphate/cardiolipin synthase-like enzyme